MRLKLILKKIISNVITRNLTKTDATEFLISLLEKSENAKDRVVCIDTLVKLNDKTEKIYKIFEYSLISDHNPEVREAAIRGIVNNFNEDSTKYLFEWVLQNENSIRVLKSVINSLVEVNQNLSKHLEKKLLLRYSKIFDVLPEEAQFFWDLETILCKKQEIGEIGKSLFELSNVSKSLSMIPKNFPPNSYRPSFITKKKRVHFLNLSGYGLKIIPGSIKLLSNLNYLDLSHNLLENLPDSIISLSKLSYLNLSHNRLITIPDSINSLSRLKYFNISFNPIKPIPESLLMLAKEKFSRRYIWSGVVPSEAPILGLLEILSGYQLFSIGKRKDFNINHEFFNTYRINAEGNVTGFSIYDNQLNLPIISIIPEQICKLKHLEVVIIPIDRIEVIPDCIRNIVSFTDLENRYINR